MNDTERIKHQLSLCSPAQREEVFRHLRQEFPIHPLEAALHTKAEIILEAIQRAGGLTLRMIRGVIAEAAFEVEVVERLKGWQKVPRAGDLPYDFLLKGRKGDVRVQVKLQRSEKGRPKQTKAGLFVVETQKSRKGEKTGRSTRPYRFGEFDLLAVAMYPSANRWDAFLYTVADWLLPDPTDPATMFKYQPVAITPNDDWTNNFYTAVAWLRSGHKKTIRGE